MKRPYRRFALTFIAVIGLYLLMHFVLWKACTEDLLTDARWHAGDLARTGYIVGSKYYRKDVDTLPIKHVEYRDYRGWKVDLLDVGDSFSYGGGGGENRYYQDWIASMNNLSVLHSALSLEDSTPLEDPIELVATLANSGYLDKMAPRYVLIEKVERSAVQTLARGQNFEKTGAIEDIGKAFISYKHDFSLPKVSFVNTGNLKMIANTVLYKFSDHAFFSDVYMARLSRPMFSVKNESTLLFSKDDIDKIHNAQMESVWQMNENLNALAEMLRRKGIKLYFMPVVDKYDLYSDYIIDNPYPKSRFFELLRQMDRKYYLIDTKAILSEELAKGEKDIYYADDTHWSWKAMKAVFEKVRFE